MAKGKGPSLGAALVGLVGSAGGRKSTYQAKGWHAQLSALTATTRGQSYLEASGLGVTRRTLLAWLAEDRAPTRRNQQFIREAYTAAARKPFPRDELGGMLRIEGKVGFGDDVRDRGNGCAPLLVEPEHDDAWDRLEDLWEQGNLDPDLWEEYFAEDVIGDDPALDDASPGDVSFPGGAYSVSA
jgi:hypothetical protein